MSDTSHGEQQATVRLDAPVRSHRRTTQWNLVSNYAAVATATLSGVILVPLYLRYIPVDTYGIWLATGNVLAWVTAIDPGLSNVLQQKVAVAYGKKDWKCVGSLITAGAILASVIALLAGAVGWLIGGHILQWLSAPNAHDGPLLIRAFNIAVAGAALSIFAFALAAINVGLQGSLGVGAINLVASLSGIGASVILILDGYGVVAIAGGMLVRGIAYSVGHGTYLAYRLLRERLGLLLEAGEFKSLSMLSTTTFLGRAGGMLSTRIDLFLVAHLVSPEAVTMLSMTRKAAEVNIMIVERPSAAFMPAVSHLMGTEDLARARGVLHRLMLSVLWLAGLVAGGMAAFNDDFVRLWVGSHLFAGTAVTIAICGAFALRVVSNSLSNIGFAMGDISRNSLVAFLQSLVFAAIVFGLTRRWGIIGVPLASALSLLLISIGYYSRVFVSRLGYGKTDIMAMCKELLLVTGLAVLLAFVSFRLRASTWPQLALAVTAFSACYATVLYVVSGAFRAQTRSIVGQLVLALRSRPEGVV